MNHYTMAELSVGMTETFQTTLTQAMMDGFRALSSDTNPLHCNAEYAAQKGYPSPVVYGMLVASLLSTLAGVYLPGENSLLQSVNVKFHAPSFVRDTLTVSGTIAEKYDELNMIVVKAVVRNQRSEKVASAKVQVGVRS